MKKKENNLKRILSLSFSLAKIKFKLRNERSYLGLFWYLLEPLLLFGILLLLQVYLVNHRQPYYDIYLITGLIIFNFFRQSTYSSTQSLIENSKYIKSMTLPREIYVLENLFVSVFSHLFEILIIVILLLYNGLSLVGIFFYPIIFILLFFFSLGISFVLSIFSVYIRDIGNVWNVFTRLLWFITPIFYYFNYSSHNFSYYLIKLNPLYYFISFSRDIFIYQKFPSILSFSLLFFMSFIVFVIGLIIFEKNKLNIAEYL